MRSTGLRCQQEGETTNKQKWSNEKKIKIDATKFVSISGLIFALRVRTHLYSYSLPLFFVAISPNTIHMPLVDYGSSSEEDENEIQGSSTTSRLDGPTERRGVIPLASEQTRNKRRLEPTPDVGQEKGR
jgi:hypothetical protein